MAPHAEEAFAHTNGWSSSENTLEDVIREEPLNTKREIDVVCIGAGVSGLAAAMKVQESMPNCNFDIYEKNGDLGGTWLENRYPGCACDVPAHAYAYTFEPNPDYSRYYIGSVEIHNYLKAVAKKHALGKYIRYHHKLNSAIWNEYRGVWELEFEVSTPENPQHTTIFKRDCAVLINACGLLNNWKWPIIPGLNDFKGHLCHSARWDRDYDFYGKKVAIIGSGSSAIQIVPELQRIAQHLSAFIRSPTWIAPSQGFVDPKTEGPLNFFYTDEDKKKFREDPDYFLAYRKSIESDMNRTFGTFMKGSEKQKGALEEFAKMMKSRLGGNEELSELLTPKWGVGCRRLTPGQNFLESLIKENVTVVKDEIERIEEKSLVTADGKLHEVDAIVCATGFDTTYKPRFKLVGRQQAPLSELWADTNDIEAYLAVAIPDFPNYFMFNGPNAPISNGTLIPVLEKQCDYMLKMVQKMQREHIKAVCVRRSVTYQLNIRHQQFLQRMVFSDNCRSWYKGGRAEGKVIGIWPGSSLHYYETISEPRYEDYEYVHHSRNMWNFLGNGSTQLEADDDENGGKNDLSFYLTKPDELLRAPESYLCGQMDSTEVQGGFREGIDHRVE
ncbi:FAD/NAD(P)-binding domain-containing protein [Viridothelium virens]|uniref:FAD/NAD(P)-binding domain-containing protein n=1 Tax=Viridothelium virens TaxID=1048519 RepID=A0A6A6HNY7_VIRVR|nr:FAD/NAD(P)-binding domain-containing protein [Viridothelium virens]